MQVQMLCDWKHDEGKDKVSIDKGGIDLVLC